MDDLVTSLLRPLVRDLYQRPPLRRVLLRGEEVPDRDRGALGLRSPRIWRRASAGERHCGDHTNDRKRYEHLSALHVALLHIFACNTDQSEVGIDLDRLSSSPPIVATHRPVRAVTQRLPVEVRRLSDRRGLPGPHVSFRPG